MVLDKTLESPLDGKEIQPVHPKGNQSNDLTYIYHEMITNKFTEHPSSHLDTK